MTVGYENNKRWRKKNPPIRYAGKRRYYRQFQENVHNRKQRWTIEDINIILDKKIIDRNISFLIGRSVGSIQCKRARLKSEIKRKKEKVIKMEIPYCHGEPMIPTYRYRDTDGKIYRTFTCGLCNRHEEKKEEKDNDYIQGR